ncbi:MAG: ABC transporter permease [Firmicutes bacterium]|nr:ABC transporter permease [Bacillota bacterium]
MFTYMLKRFLSIIPMLLLITIIIFIGLELTPGDPLTYMLDPELLASQAIDIEAYKEAMGLNDPLYVRYFRWLGEILKGNLGYSLVDGSSIAKVLARRIPATFELAVVALIISSVLGITLGLISSIKQNSFIDYFNTTIGMVGISVPEFFIGILAILFFAIKLKWLPIGGRIEYGHEDLWGRLSHLIMPAVIMGVALTAALMRYTRGTMLDVLNKDYVKTARSKGLPEWKVIIFHAFRNALSPVIMLLCFRLPMLIGGSVIIESIFSWPGMGKTILDAISGKDYPVVMITTMLTSLMILVASFLADLLTALLDPRVRFN